MGLSRADAAGRGDAPHFLYRASEAVDPPEVRLARAKLLTMLEIIGGTHRELPSRSKAREAHREEARRWFFGPSDFEWWCESAGYEPGRMRARARRVESEGWRATTGCDAKVWRLEDDALLIAEKANGTSDLEIGRRLGRTRIAVVARHSKLSRLASSGSPGFVGKVR